MPSPIRFHQPSLRLPLAAMAVALVALASGCDRKPSAATEAPLAPVEPVAAAVAPAGTCPAPTASIDGHDVGLPVALARRTQTVGALRYELLLSTSAKADCSALPDRGAIVVPDDGSSFQLLIDDDGRHDLLVGFGKKTRRTVGRIDKRPTAPGDPLEVCVYDAVTVTAADGRRARLHGRWAAVFCGGVSGAASGDVPSSERCRSSADCKESGACSLVGERCRATAETDCRSSAGCRRHGRCSLVGSGCAARNREDCQRSSECRAEGNCSLERDLDRCAPAADEDCVITRACSEEGRCVYASNRHACDAANEDDCKASTGCKELGRCTLAGDRCTDGR